ncbi:MAG: DUF924 domain-containing protein [Myxococcales bacterium]|jgi:uncharacterized protein (DUF924 family)|nr:DUF924 domain-containing protein [Myxococcales bacterium]
MAHEIDEVLTFWFGGLSVEGLASPEKTARWFAKDPAFDREIAERFGALHEAIAKREREGFRDTAKGLLAYVLVLDQFSRNMFRDTPQAFAYDDQALDAARHGIHLGFDRMLVGQARAFLYMPFMHSESLEAQDQGVSLFREFRREVGEGALGQAIQTNLDFMLAHERIIARFRRFPHRNAILGRKSTDEERAFLEEPGSSF